MGNITKIVFFISTPFSERDYHRFGIEILQENGFEVEVWDFTPFLYPQIYQAMEVPDPIDYEGYYLFLTWNEALSAISKLASQCLVFCWFGFYYKTFSIYRALSKNNIKYCLITALAFLPSLSSNRDAKNSTSFFNKLKKLTSINSVLTYIRSSALIDFVLPRIPYKYLGINPPTFVLAGGERSVAAYRYPIGAETKILWLHTLDYDIYLKEKQKLTRVETSTGVFLDMYLPFQADYSRMGVSPPVSPKEYYPLLCRFFDYLENNHGVRIIIAAHPRSHYEDHPDYFGGRPVIRGKTAELVRKSGFVILHSSTAINFSVLFKKPLIFITTNELQLNPLGSRIDRMASFLGKRVINLNDTSAINLKEELMVNEKAYKDYKNSYIKRNGTEDIFFWQVFANHIKGF